MRSPTMLLALMVTMSLALGACTETAPTDPATQAQRTDPNGNPLQGTVFDAQGEALAKARRVEDILARSAEQQRRAADDAGE